MSARPAGRPAHPDGPPHPPGAPAPRGHGQGGRRHRRRGPDPPGAAHRGRRGDRPTGPGPQRDAGPDRDGLRPAGAVRGPTAELPGRRLPRAADPPDLHPGLRRAPAEGRPRRRSRTGTGPCPASRRRRPAWASLVGDLAVLAREGEGPEPARYRVDLAAVAAEAVADAKTLDATRPIELHAPDRGPGGRGRRPARADGPQPARATPWPTPRRAPRWRSAWPCAGAEAVLEVRDRGPGMSPEQARHVFDRFYRGDGDRLDGGSGLGLFIVATLARTFGGAATVDSEVGRGSTFQVVLPRLRPTRPPPTEGGAVGMLASIDRGTGPPVVLLHGQPGSGASWDPVTDLLAGEFRVLAPDRVGYGASAGRGPGPGRQRRPHRRVHRGRRGGAGHRGGPQLVRRGGRPAGRPTTRHGGPQPGAGRRGLHPRQPQRPRPWLTYPGVGDVLTVARPGGHRRGAAPAPPVHPVRPRPLPPTGGDGPARPGGPGRRVAAPSAATAGPSWSSSGP